MMSQKYIYPSLFQEEDPHESIPSEKTEYDLTNLFDFTALNSVLKESGKAAVS